MAGGQGMKRVLAAVTFVAFVFWQAASAQELAKPALADAASATPQAPSVSSTTLDVCAAALAEGRQGTCIPALTPVQIELAEPLSSRTSVTGQSFALSLVWPISVHGNELVAKGAKGQGEVVHAKKTGVGVGGELVLAARYLQIGDKRLRLRSMHLNGAGRDQQGLAFAVGVAVGLPALFVRGKHIDIPAGAYADAKTAEPFWIDGPTVGAGSSAEPEQAQKISTKEGVPNVP